MNAQQAHQHLAGVVREQLAAAFDRGKAAQRHWDNTGQEVLADTGAPAAFTAIEDAADACVQAVADAWRARAVTG